MRKGLAIAVAATLGLGAWQAASAADLPVKAPPMSAVAAPPLWTGCYLGGNLGAAWGSREITTSFGTSGSASSNAHFAGGGQIGCDIQAGAWVFGIRDMFDWADAKATRNIAVGPFAGYSAELKNNWLDLLTGRVGYTVQPNWLLYFQAGAAWRKNSLTFFAPGGAEVADFSKTRAGWTIGGGAEWMFTQGWSAFLEYDHADFGTNTGTFNSALLGPISISAKSNVDLFLVGFNWRPHF